MIFSMNLKELFPDYYLENEQFECKGRLNRDQVLGWLKTIDGFANAKGGTLFIGVEDKTLDLIGFDASEVDKEKIYFFNTINEHFQSRPLITINVVPYMIRDKKRFVMKINILESHLKPVILKYQGMPMIFVRRDGFTNPATEEEIREMSISSNSVSFDDYPTDVLYAFEDFSKLSDFYTEHNDGRKLTEKEIKSVGFTTEEGFLKRGSFLFSDKYKGDETRVVCSLFRGVTRGDDEVITSNSFSGNLIDSYKFMWEFIQQRMSHSFIKTETGRLNVDSYASRALFEAIINSLAHRNYFLKGSQINVDMFSNRLVISSPGSFYNSGDIKATYNFDSIISRRRNELICRILILCNAMEAKGTGFEKIKEEYKKYDLKHQPFIFSKNNQFSIVLPDVCNPLGVSILEESFEITGKIINPSRFDLNILSFCFEEDKSIKEITEHLAIADSTFFRNSVIKNLVDQNYLIESKEKNKKIYRTNSSKVFLK